jgi:hypothetical protein
MPVFAALLLELRRALIIAELGMRALAIIPIKPIATVTIETLRRWPVPAITTEETAPVPAPDRLRGIAIDGTGFHDRATTITVIRAVAAGVITRGAGGQGAADQSQYRDDTHVTASPINPDRIGPGYGRIFAEPC